MGTMADGEAVIRAKLATLSDGDHVGSVNSLGAMTDLSTGAVIAIMQSLADEGLVVSTRGPKGGYWRTAQPMPQPDSQTIPLDDDVRQAITAELADISTTLASLATRVTALAATLSDDRVDGEYLSVDEARARYARKHGLDSIPEPSRSLLIPTYPEGTREYTQYQRALGVELDAWAPVPPAS